MPHLILNGWFTGQTYTGSGQYLHHLLARLPDVAPDFEVTLVAPAARLATLPDDALPASVHRVGLPIPPGNLGKVYFEQIAFPRACRRLKADLAHVPYWAPPLRSPVPVVATIHDIIPLLLPEHRGAWKVQLYTALVSSTAQGAAHVIADSHASRNDIIEHLGLDPAHVTAIHLAADERFDATAALTPAIRARYGLPEEDAYVLYLGGFHRRKNVHQLIAAWTWAAGSIGEYYPLVIAGKLPDTPDGKLFYDLPALVDELKLGDTVRFIGPVDEADKPAIYAGAAAFVFPSAYEGFGLPPLEAMACDTAVVTTDKSSLGEVVGDAAYLIPDPTDARLLGAAIIAVVVNDTLSAELRRKGQIQAAKFSWRRTVEETVGIYRRVLGQAQ